MLEDVETQFLFFSISAAFTLGWTTISSLLGFYKQQFGPQILLHLNMANFLPSVPVLVLQTIGNGGCREHGGSGRLAATQLCTGLAVCAVVCVLYPLAATEEAMLACVGVLGFASGLAFGASYQLVSEFPGRSSVALTTGFVGAGPVVLAWQAVLGIGADPAPRQLAVLFALATGATLLGLAAALRLVSKHGRLLQERDARQYRALPQQKERGDLEMPSTGAAAVAPPPPGAAPRQWQELHPPTQAGPGRAQPAASAADSPAAPLLLWSGRDGERADEVGLGAPEPRAGHLGGSTRALLGAIWPAMAAQALSIGTSVLVFPFFTYVPSHGRLGNLLPQVLFAGRVASDIAGRLLPRSSLLSSPSGLLGLALLKTAATPLFFLYCHDQLPLRSDAAAMAWVCAFWLASGHISKVAYLVAPRWVPGPAKPRAGSMMALTFQLACTAALLLAFLLEAWTAPVHRALFAANRGI